MIRRLSSGLVVKVGAIDRNELDALALVRARPEPPTKKVEVWGGIVEDVPVLTDPAYRSELDRYYAEIGRSRFSVLTPGLEIIERPKRDATAVDELAEILPAAGTMELELAVAATDEELVGLVEEVEYLSTVTERGIDEAVARFSVRWDGRDVLGLKIPGLPFESSQLYRDRLAARSLGYTWRAFCELSGPEQSSEVAFYLITQYVNFLKDQR